MPSRAKKKPKREPVTQDRAVLVAVELADAVGLEQLTMRRLAEELGIEAMSLYHHFPSKTAILDGMVDKVFAEIELPARDVHWKIAMRRRGEAVRAALIRHPWALSLMESRSAPGPATLEHHDAVLGCLRGAGFSIALTAHAYALLDSYIYGFVLTELNLPFKTSEETHEVAKAIFQQFPVGAYPHLVELTTQHVLKPGYAYSNEFAFGFELVLDSLERALRRERSGKRARRGTPRE